MAIRSPAQDIYFIETTATIIAAPTWSGTDGLDVDKFNLVPTNKPDLLSAKQVSDTRKCTGLATRRVGAGLEFTKTIEVPVCAGLTVEMTRKNIGLFIWLLLQTGASESDTTPFKITGIPYTDHACEVFCALGRLLDGSTESHLITGAIISSLTIAGTEGGVITLSADFIGRDFDNSADLSGLPTTVPDEAPALFQELTTPTLDGNEIDLQSFEITITNNAISRTYDSPLAEKHVLGDLDISGNIVIPWDQTNESKNVVQDSFLSGGDKQLVLAWPTDTTNGIEFKVNMYYTEEPTLPADSADHTLSISFIGAYDGTNNALDMSSEDTVDRGIT